MNKNEMSLIKKRRKLCQKAVQETAKFKRVRGEYERFKEFLIGTHSLNKRIDARTVENFLAWRSIKAGKSEEDTWIGLESLRRVRTILIEILEQLNYEPNPAKSKSLGQFWLIYYNC